MRLEKWRVFQVTDTVVPPDFPVVATAATATGAVLTGLVCETVHPILLETNGNTWSLTFEINIVSTVGHLTGANVAGGRRIATFGRGDEKCITLGMSDIADGDSQCVTGAVPIIRARLDRAFRDDGHFHGLLQVTGIPLRSSLEIPLIVS